MYCNEEVSISKKIAVANGLDQLCNSDNMHLIRLNDVSKLMGLRRSTIYKYLAERILPKFGPLGGGHIAWVGQEIQDGISERIEARGWMQVNSAA